MVFWVESYNEIMTIVVKEIEVRTTIEKRVVESESISEELHERLKEEIIEAMQSRENARQEEHRRRER